MAQHRHGMYHYGVTLHWDRIDSPPSPAPTTRTSLIWNAQTGEIRDASPPLGDDDWLVDVEWEVVGDSALPTGLTVRSSLPPGSVRQVWLNPIPKPVSREVLKRLPVGAIVRRGRKLLPPLSEVPGLTQLAEAAERGGVRNDWLYREVAKAYLRAANDPRIPPGELARATWELLKQHPDPRLYTDDRVRVRKWILRARRLGYLPPAAGKAL